MKLEQKYLATSTFIATLILSNSGTVLAQTNINQIIQESDRYSTEKITQVKQLQDISPADWSYEAVRSLSEKYNCVSGLPNQTFQGEGKITRYEFAAGLNSCLKKIEGLISSQRQTNLASFLFSGSLIFREEDGSITIIDDAGFIPEPWLPDTSTSNPLCVKILLF